jgi:hypothetical protein
MAWIFADATNTMAIRDTDGAFVPWNPNLNQPVDIDSGVGRSWLAAGSPIPNPYVAPSLSAAQLRENAFKADQTRIDLITHLKNDTLAQIETFVRNQINADGVTNLATAQQALKRIETSIVILFKALALSVRE